MFDAHIPFEIPPPIRPHLLGSDGAKIEDRTKIEMTHASVILVPKTLETQDVIFLVNLILVRKGFPLAGIPYCLNVSNSEIKLVPIPDLHLLSLEDEPEIMKGLTHFLIMKAKEKYVDSEPKIIKQPLNRKLSECEKENE